MLAGALSLYLFYAIVIKPWALIIDWLDKPNRRYVEFLILGFSFVYFGFWIGLVVDVWHRIVGGG